MECCKCKKYNWNDPQKAIWTDSNDQGYCVFHAPTEYKEVSEADFAALVARHLAIAINQNKEECNLSGTVFCGNIDFPDQTLPKLDLRDTSFEGRVVFKGCNFDLLNLNDASFEDRVAFIDCDFNGRVAFGGCTFVSDVSFDGSSFLKGAAFISTKFMGDAYFNETRFLNGLWFRDVVFSGKVHFVDSEFAHGRFWKVIAEDYIMLRYCRFTASSCIDFVEIDLLWFDFLSTNLENIRFTSCNWPQDKGRYCIQHDMHGVQLSEVLNFYQRMKRKCKTENNEYEASKWHIAEKEAQLKILKREKKSNFIWALLWLYKIFSGFGENPLRACVIFLVILFLPLATISGVEVYNCFSWHFDFDKVDMVLKDWLMFVPFARSNDFRDVSGGMHLVIIGWQLFITTQFALFAFALRNRFRR